MVIEGPAMRGRVYCAALCAAAAAIGMAGCSSNDTLVYAERSSFKLGIIVGENPATPLQVNIGLKNTVVGVVPPKQPRTSENKPRGDAANLLAGVDITYARPDITKPVEIFTGGRLEIGTHFATGRAAEALSKDANKTNQFITGSEGPAPASADVQARRANAADFVRTLSNPQRDQMAAALGVETGAKALSGILEAIANANTKASFDRIAQKIDILFGRKI